MQKHLIIRFSSFGDIAQALPAARAIRTVDPHGEIHFATRMDFAEFVKSHAAIDRVWALKREGGTKGLLDLIGQLHAEGFTHIYDAHNNLRSFFLCWGLKFLSPKRKILRRSKNRIRRFLLFTLGLNTFKKPFQGSKSYCEPLEKWFGDIPYPMPELLKPSAIAANLDQIPLHQALAFAPSANWELKRWPLEHWRELAKICPTPIVLLGGKEDTFCNDIAAIAPERVVSLAGKLSWTDTVSVIKQVRGVVSNDTGVLHVADLMGRPTVALIGPTAFGYPSQPTSTVLEVKLSCRPCTKDGRGKCKNPTFKKCLVDIKPEAVLERIRHWG